MEIDLSKYPFSPPRKGKVKVAFRDLVGAALTLVYDPSISGNGTYQGLMQNYANITDWLVCRAQWRTFVLRSFFGWTRAVMPVSIFTRLVWFNSPRLSSSWNQPIQ